MPTLSSTPEDKQQSSDGWMCWDLFCHKFNASENSVCYDCGNHRGYQPPELESLIKEALQSQLEELIEKRGRTVDHTMGHPIVVDFVPLSAIKEMEERL